MVANKAAFYKLFRDGKLGNRPQTWYSLSELYQSDYSGDVSIRCRIPNSKVGAFHVPIEELNGKLEEVAEANKMPISNFLFNESPPDHRLIFQGEVYRSECGLEMFYSTAKMAMRPALGQQGRQVCGLLPFLLITQHMDGSSQDNLWRLLDTYPDSVVEFSTYEIPVGDEKRNTIFWEVRKY